jgi:hypothetical protein
MRILDIKSGHRSKPAIERFLESVAPISAVIKHAVCEDDYAVLFTNRQGEYAACRVHPMRHQISTPNYFSETEHGVLTATMSAGGLADLLHWTDRETALARFASIANPAVTAISSPNVVSLIPVSGRNFSS